MNKLALFRAALVCPACRQTLADHSTHLTCERCQKRYPIDHATVYFVGDPKNQEDLSNDVLYRLKAFLKSRSWLFRLAYWFQPALAIGTGPESIAEPANPSGLYLNLGSGSPLYTHVKGVPLIQVDLHPYPGVDIVCDASRLPFADNGIDGICNESLMEHTPDPAAIVTEAHRVLKSGARAYFVLPQVAPFHATPYDYHRWTRSGGLGLLKSFDSLATGVRHGPVSAWLWLTQELIATLLSFGYAPLYAFWTIAAMVTTFPIKWIDALAARLPGAERCALTLYFLVGKTEGTRR